MLIEYPNYVMKVILKLPHNLFGQSMYPIGQNMIWDILDGRKTLLGVRSPWIPQSVDSPSLQLFEKQMQTSTSVSDPGIT